MICTLLLASMLVAPREISLELKDVSLLDAVDAVTRAGQIRVAIAPEVLAASKDLPTVTMSARAVDGGAVLDAVLNGGGLALQDVNGVATITVASPRVSALKNARSVIKTQASGAQPAAVVASASKDAGTRPAPEAAEVKGTDASTIATASKPRDLRLAPSNSHLQISFHASARE